MAGKRKVDSALVAYFSKVKKKEINPKLSYEDFWVEVVEGTILDDQCEYHGTDRECIFVIASDDTKFETLTYQFDDVHNSEDPGDIRWNVILHDALTYIKKNKILQKKH